LTPGRRGLRWLLAALGWYGHEILTSTCRHLHGVHGTTWAYHESIGASTFSCPDCGLEWDATCGPFPAQGLSLPVACWRVLRIWLGYQCRALAARYNLGTHCKGDPHGGRTTRG